MLCDKAKDLLRKEPNIRPVQSPVTVVPLRFCRSRFAATSTASSTISASFLVLVGTVPA